VIIWLNGGFGPEKTTLAQELHRRFPDAVVYDPEDVGLRLWKWMRPNGGFQDLPSWRELVVATALSVGRHHGGLADAGEEVIHVFLEADAAVLRERLKDRVVVPTGNPEADQSARGFGLRHVDAAVAAAARQPGGTLMLRSHSLTPAEMADDVLAGAFCRQ
jgi:hypothetical protein